MKTWISPFGTKYNKIANLAYIDILLKQCNDPDKIILRLNKNNPIDLYFKIKGWKQKKQNNLYYYKVCLHKKHFKFVLADVINKILYKYGYYITDELWTSPKGTTYYVLLDIDNITIFYNGNYRIRIQSTDYTKINAICLTLDYGDLWSHVKQTNNYYYITYDTLDCASFINAIDDAIISSMYCLEQEKDLSEIF